MKTFYLWLISIWSLASGLFVVLVLWIGGYKHLCFPAGAVTTTAWLILLTNDFWKE